jgi:hypothetical protein
VTLKGRSLGADLTKESFCQTIREYGSWSWSWMHGMCTCCDGNECHDRVVYLPCSSVFLQSFVAEAIAKLFLLARLPEPVITVRAEQKGAPRAAGTTGTGTVAYSSYVS